MNEIATRLLTLAKDLSRLDPDARDFLVDYDACIAEATELAVMAERDAWWIRMPREEIAAELSATFDLGLPLTRRIADWILGRPTMNDLTPETLREEARQLRRFGMAQIADLLDAYADAWEADRLAGHEWRIEGEGLRERLKAADALAKAAEKHYYEDADLARALSSVKADAGWHRRIRIEEADDECHHEWTRMAWAPYPLVRCIKCGETRAE